MRIGVYNYHQGKNQSSSMFENPKIAIGDDLMKPFQVMRRYFNEQGHELCSVSDYPMMEFDAVLFIEWPTLPFLLNPYFHAAKEQKKPMYLLLLESEIIRPSNFRKPNHSHFEKIFTWKDTLIDDKRYIKICVPQNLPDSPVFSGIRERGFLTLISSNKLHDHPFELYSERVRAIRFFEKALPNTFDLYGGGWDKIAFSSVFMRYLGMLPGYMHLYKILNTLFFQPFPSWKGKVNSKFETLSKYKFAICYENAKNIPGYITEKIFDCFFSGCVPIYLGPPNINDFIPKNTYIDKNDFQSYEDLLKYLRGLTDLDLLEFQENILKYLSGTQAQKFSSQAFSQILFQHIITK